MPPTPPFVFDKPVPPADVIGRDDVLAVLHDRAAHGRFMLLAAPRRFGKTSLVHRLAADGARTGDLHVVHVDLLGVQGLGDVVRRFARALRALPARGPLRRTLEGLVRHAPDMAAAIGWGAVTVTARRPNRPAPAADATLEALLDLPAQAAARLDAAVLVVLDEFQDIDRVEGADATIRAVIQHQEQVAYLFAGSEQSTMEMVFSDRRRALYAQAERVPLPPLADADLGEFVDRRFQETARALDAAAMVDYLDFVAGHPQRAMLVAHHLWTRTPEGGTARPATVASAVADALEGFAYEGAQLMRTLSAAQAKTLRLVAHGEPVHGTQAARLGLAKSSASRALDGLRQATVVTGDPSGLVDPLLGEWLRQELPLR